MTIVEHRDRERADVDYDAARRVMIESQLRPSGVNAPFVLRRMSEVAREQFVPDDKASAAYIDRAVPLPGGRWLAAPIMQGMMLQEARPRLDDRTLLVDGGSGYMAELLRGLVGTLVVVDVADAANGRVPGSDYTLLVVDGAAEQLPTALIERLSPEARIVTGQASNGVTRLAVGRVVGGAAALLPLAEMGIPVLPEFAAPKRWTF